MLQGPSVLSLDILQHKLASRKDRRAALDSGNPFCLFLACIVYGRIEIDHAYKIETWMIGRHNSFEQP
jgi:hypothetical protein